MFVITNLDFRILKNLNLLPMGFYLVIRLLNFFVELFQSTFTRTHAWFEIFQVFLVPIQLLLNHICIVLDNIANPLVFVNRVRVVLENEGRKFALFFLESIKLRLY